MPYILIIKKYVLVTHLQIDFADVNLLQLTLNNNEKISIFRN